LIRRQDQVALAVNDPNQFCVLPQDDACRAQRGLDCRITELAPGSCPPRCRSQEVGLRFCRHSSFLQLERRYPRTGRTMIRITSKRPSPATEKMEWQPQIEPAAEKENKENQKQN